MKVDEIIKSMESKLDDTSKGLIADDLGNLIQFSYNKESEINELKAEKETLKSEKERLLTVNGNLLQKIPMGKEEKNDEPEVTKSFNFRSIFDDKGNIKR